MSLRAKLVLATAALALWAVPAGPAMGAAGDLDGAFGAGGKARIDLGGTDYGFGTALRPDGRILVTGKSDSDAIVAQVLQPQGVLDTAYGGGTGWSRLHFGDSNAGYALAVRPDGRVVMTGQTSGGAPGSDAIVAQLLDPQGTLDPAFGGGDGWSRIDFGAGETSYAMVLQSDGRTVFGGARDKDGTVVRLDPAGALDTFYGGGFGWSLLDLGGSDVVNGVALQADGRIVAAGHGGPGQEMAVSRLVVPGGTFDPSFGAGTGRTFIDFGGTTEYGEAVAIQGDGAIVAAGTTETGTNGEFAVARLLPGGGLDPTFDGDGRAVIDFGGYDFGSAVALQPDGRILVAGQTYTAGSGNMAVARLLPSGALDPSFGTGGKVTVDFGADDGAFAIALQKDGRIDLVGDSRAPTGSDLAIAQLQGDPRPAPGPPVALSARASCAGRAATIVGTAGSDALRGTPRADVIAALGGNDTVTGLGGADLVCGGAGADALAGGTGPDRLLGGPGADRISGGPGADALEGGAGPDRLAGGIGPDRLLGGPGADRLLGGAGRDRLLGGPGRNLQTP